MSEKKYTIMLGHEIERVLKIKGLTKTELAKLICEKYPEKDNGKVRNEDTTRNTFFCGSGGIVKMELRILSGTCQ